MSKDDDCCGKKKTVRETAGGVRRSLTKHGCIREGLMNPATRRALEIICEMESLLHMDTKEGIGHIHYLIDERAAKQLQALRAEILGLLSHIPEKDRQEHLSGTLQARCGSVATFIQSGKLPESKFDVFYHRLMELDRHFHEPGEKHVHRVPTREELEHVSNLRQECLGLIREIPEKQKLAAILNLCCGTTVEFVKSGKIAPM